jgi:O-acetyl-ADP-ribose deacetylase (regulator of RNase III)
LSTIRIVNGDITQLDVDIIVNAANARLIPGGGVDGAINRAAGPELGLAMMKIGGCATGQAVVTPGFALRAKHVIHTVAPIFGQHTAEDVWQHLFSCYRNVFALARQLKGASIALPSLGTGAYGIPITKASRIAVTSALEHQSLGSDPRDVVFCCFGDADARHYGDALDWARNIQPST